MKKAEKNDKRKRKAERTHTKIFTVVVSGCWEYRLFCFAYMSWFLLLFVLLVSKYSFIKREKNQSF